MNSNKIRPWRYRLWGAFKFLPTPAYYRMGDFLVGLNGWRPLFNRADGMKPEVLRCRNIYHARRCDRYRWHPRDFHVNWRGSIVWDDETQNAEINAAAVLRETRKIVNR